MICPEIIIDSAEYCDSEENKSAGFSDLATVWLHQDVATYPAYAGVAAGDITAMAAKQMAAAAIVLKTGKKPFKLPCIIEKNGLQTKSQRGGFNSEATLRIQNTAHNRSVIDQLKGARFSLGMKPAEDDMVLLGQSDGLNSQFLAMVVPDSVLIEYGSEFSSDKYIEFKISAKPFAPVLYTHAISYEPAA